MKLRFKQRAFSWLDSYDVYDETGNIYFKVNGQMALSHAFNIYDKNGGFVGSVKQTVFSLLPTFYIYDNRGNELGYIKKELSLFTPRLTVNINGWEVEGDFLGWEYAIYDDSRVVATISKELFQFTDTYTITVAEKHAKEALLVVLAIDAINCNR